MFRLLMLLTLITLTGCGQPVAPLSVQPVAVPPRAPLSPEDSEVASFNARLAQLDLELAESSTGNDDNEMIKENLRRYAAAISDSADPILAEPDASVSLRRRAAEAKFDVTLRRLPFDPGLLGPFLKMLDRIDLKARDDSIADLTAYYRVIALCEDIAPEALQELASDAFADYSAAVIKLGKVERFASEAPAIILQTAREAERRQLDPLALELYERYAMKFPEQPAALFAAGSAEKLSVIGKAVQVVEGPGLDGKTIALADFRGKVVLLDYWSTWSDSWSADLVHLRRFRDEFGPQGFEIVGVNLDTDAGKVREVLKTEQVDWPQITPALGSSDPWKTALGLRFGVSELPYRLVFNREGRLVAFGTNLVDLEMAIQGALNSPVVAEPEKF